MASLIKNDLYNSEIRDELYNMRDYTHSGQRNSFYLQAILSLIRSTGEKLDSHFNRETLLQCIKHTTFAQDADFSYGNLIRDMVSHYINALRLLHNRGVSNKISRAVLLKEDKIDDSTFTSAISYIYSEAYHHNHVASKIFDEIFTQDNGLYFEKFHKIYLELADYNTRLEFMLEIVALYRRDNLTPESFDKTYDDIKGNNQSTITEKSATEPTSVRMTLTPARNINRADSSADAAEPMPVDSLVAAPGLR